MRWRPRHGGFTYLGSDNDQWASEAISEHEEPPIHKGLTTAIIPCSQNWPSTESGIEGLSERKMGPAETEGLSHIGEPASEGR